MKRRPICTIIKIKLQNAAIIIKLKIKKNILARNITILLPLRPSHGWAVIQIFSKFLKNLFDLPTHLKEVKSVPVAAFGH